VISYAQNGEDVMLARVFGRKTDGFYVDVGAGHPTLESVTKHFYDLGWRGISIEPLAREYELLCSERPRDVNVHAAISDVAGETVIFGGPPENRGASTIVPDVARSYEAQGQVFVPEAVRMMTLADVLSEHASRDIDFLKIDVEGNEAAIVKGFDWSRFKIRVVVIEATEPNSQRPSYEAWEGSIIESGYARAMFDGLNAFYVRSEDHEALGALSVPVNVFDDVQPWRWLSQIRSLEDHVRDLESRLRRPLVRLAVKVSGFARGDG
jgi:FkbM family methyltransferase